MSRNSNITAGWPEVCQTVEEILKARATVTSCKIGQTEITRKKPMKFADFAKEIGRDRAEAYRWIRNGQVPDLKNQKIVTRWCKKHAAAILPGSDGARAQGDHQKSKADGGSNRKAVATS